MPDVDGVGLVERSDEQGAQLDESHYIENNYKTGCLRLCFKLTTFVWKVGST